LQTLKKEQIATKNRAVAQTAYAELTARRQAARNREALVNKATTKIQAIVRGQQARKKFKQHAAATTIQRAFRKQQAARRIAINQNTATTINPVPSTTLPKPTTAQIVPTKNFFSRHKEQVLGGAAIVSALGALAGSITLILIITGVILLPATFGGSMALIGLGGGLILGGAILGGTVGAGIASLIEHSPKENNEPFMSPIMTTGSLRMSFEIKDSPLLPNSKNTLSASTRMSKPGITQTQKSTTTKTDPSTSLGLSRSSKVR
jgi:hypothetical protein